MSRFSRIATKRLASDAIVANMASLACFATAIILLVLVLATVVKLATTPFEIFEGLLLGAICSTLFVLMGMVLPLTVKAEGD